MVILAFMTSCPPTVAVSSSPLQTRLEFGSIVSGMGKPSAVPDTIDHSPCNWAMSFLVASLSSAQASEIAEAASTINKVVDIVFMSVFGLV